MAEVTGLRNNALPYPIYGLPFGVTFPLLDADGDPISPSSPDSEVSKNGDTFADCTNEATEIATSSGICYLLLTGTEMTADVVTVQIKSTGAKTTVVTLYPRKLVSIRAGTSASGGVSTSTIVLDGSASAVDDFYNGMACAAVIDSVTEVRLITDYTGSSQTATVTPDWNTAPDNNDTFTVYRPDGVQMQQANVSHWNSLTTVELPLVPTTAGRKLDVSAGGEAGVDWANVGSPTTSLALTGTTIATTQKVDVETIKTNPVVNAGTVTFPTTATLASTTNITAGTITTATNLTNAPSAGDFTATMKTSIGTAVAASAVASVTGNVGGNVTGSVGSVVGAVGSVTGAVGSVTGNVGGNVTGSVGSVTGLTASDVAAIKVITDALGSTAAARLKLSAERIVTGTIDTAGFSPTTTEFEADDITEATADHYNGRIIIFTSGALVNQATSISDYSLATGRGHFTVVAMTEAPANNDTFIIV